jgi:hypothetical protein
MNDHRTASSKYMMKLIKITHLSYIHRFHHFPLSDGQLLMCFCVFAIGGPLLFLTVALATHHTANANMIQPNFGVTSCWFGGECNNIINFVIKAYMNLEV